MDGSPVPADRLMGRLVDLVAALERRLADERARSNPDEAAIRRLCREKLLARDRLAALSGCAMPRWARQDQNEIR